MPTSSSNSPNLAVEEYFAQMRERASTQTYTTLSPDTFFYTDGTLQEPPEPNRWQKAAATRKRYAQERAKLTALLTTGSSNKLSCYLDRHGRLLVKLNDSYPAGSPWLFVLDKRQLTVNNKLSKHLLPLLTGLAEREGVRLKLTDEMGRCLVDKAVAFWAFKGMVEVDDRELMRLATPKPLAQEAPTPSDTVTLNWTDFPTGQDVF